MKRLTDIALSVTLLIVLTPTLFAIAFLIRVALGRPILFRQMRIGKDGQYFTVLKFRTMINEIDSIGNPLSDELRITRFGLFLRSCSLDELPELWNVLMGDMSLVGPRPLLMEYLDRYSEEQWKRHNVKPGITGWAQVNGRNQTTWEERFELDRWYIENHSFFLDLKIIGMTLVQIVKKDGISHNGVATMPEFKGSNVSSEQH